MRAKDSARLDTIRLLRAAIQRREVDERITLDDDGVIQVIQKQIKQGQDAIEQFVAGNREDLADKERAAIEILQQYLPAPLSDAEIDAAVRGAIVSTGASTVRDMGAVMAALRPTLQGRADMGAVSAKVKALLQG